MGLVFKIAWRNIFRHKGKSLVIGAILFLGALIMTIGNGVISGMDKGIEKNIVNGFLGDMVVVSDKQKDDNVLFTIMGKSIEPINNYKEIKKVLQNEKYIDKFIPIGKNMALVLNENGDPDFAYLLGVDFEEYQKMFPGTISVVEGRLVGKNEKSLLVGTGGRKQFYDFSSSWTVPKGGKLIPENFLKDAEKTIDYKETYAKYAQSRKSIMPMESIKVQKGFGGMNMYEVTITKGVEKIGVGKGNNKDNAVNDAWKQVCTKDKVDTVSFQKNILLKDNLVFMGFGGDNTSVDIRADVAGIIKYKSLNNWWGLFITMDIESYRSCQGYLGATEKVELSQEKKKLFEDTENTDDMFGTESLVIDEKTVDESVEKSMSITKVNSQEVDIEDGTYNMVLIKLKQGIKLEDAQKKINEALKKAGLKGEKKKDKSDKKGARAITWKQAAGQIGSISSIIKAALFLFVMFVFFVAIIIIVNTLSMAAIERTSEIGMMRAVGAKKRFISEMFFAETAILSFFFGGLGIITGIIVVMIIPTLNITTDNEMLQILYGGDKFNPILSYVDIGIGMVQLLIVTLVAMIYPIKVARSITPLDAISRD